MAYICSIIRYKASKSEWPWLWHFKVTQGQMSWCNLTLHIRFPIDISIIITCSHAKCFPLSLFIRPHYGNRKCTKWPHNDLERYKVKGTPYIYKVLPVPVRHNFTAFCSTIGPFPDNLGFWFLHRVQWWIWNFQKKIVENRKLKISRI